MSTAQQTLIFCVLMSSVWQGITADSIDYTMEKAANLAVFPYSGRHSSGRLAGVKARISRGRAGTDQAGNLLVGNASQTGSQSCFVWADNAEQVVTTVGMKDTRRHERRGSRDRCRPDPKLRSRLLICLALKNHSQAQRTSSVVSGPGGGLKRCLHRK